MGAWGLGPLENDNALDWTGDGNRKMSSVEVKAALLAFNSSTPAPLPPAPVQMPAPSSVPHVGPSGPRA
jgi:hypothetical protein